MVELFLIFFLTAYWVFYEHVQYWTVPENFYLDWMHVFHVFICILDLFQKYV